MTALTTLAAPARRRLGPRLAPLEVRRRPLRLGAAIVPRPRLVQLLRSGADAPLALLLAPAGYGKSTLLAQWAAADPRPFAWLRLEETDNDPLQLVCSVAAVLDATGMTTGTSDGRGLRSALLRSLETATKPFVLAVDDAHLLRNDAAFGVLTAIVEHLPWGSQLALASRSKPSLPIGRWRAHRQVVELRPADLAMSPSEARALLAGAGAEPAPAELDALVRTTEGWPAGLYLAAVASRAPVSAGSPAFDGTEPLVCDYFRDEMLAPRSPEEVQFLTQAATLDDLSGPICDAVLEREASAALLADLAESDLPVFETTQANYRLSLLFSQSLRAELRRHEPARAAEVEGRAASWYLQQGDTARAARHAVAARDRRVAGTVLWSCLPDWVESGRDAAVLGWLEPFGDEQIAAEPGLALVATAGHLAGGDRDRALQWLEAAEEAAANRHRPLTPSAGAGAALLRAWIAAEGFERMSEDAIRARALLQSRSRWVARTHLLAGVALHLSGEMEPARAELGDGTRRGAAHAPLANALCLAQLALLALDQGETMEAEALATRARAQAQRLEADTAGCALVYAVSAWARAECRRIDGAATDLRRALALAAPARAMPEWYEAETLLALARASLRLNDMPRARSLLAELERLLAGPRSSTVLRRWLSEARAAEAAEDSGQRERSALTMAELRVLQLMPTHLSYPDIAQRLNVSANTVKTHARSVYRKLGSTSRDEAVVHAQAAGLV